jgi:hypothetical protein
MGESIRGYIHSERPPGVRLAKLQSPKAIPANREFRIDLK